MFNMSMNMKNAMPMHELQSDNINFIKTNYLLPLISNASNDIKRFCIKNAMFDVQL